MRFGVFSLIVLCLAGCQSTPPEPAQDLKGQPVAVDASIGSEPKTACSALAEVGLDGGAWREGVDGFGCASQELSLGPRDSSSTLVSGVWYEVRGADPDNVTSIVLGGDVRVPEAESAVRTKMAEAARHLLQKLDIPADQELQAAIQHNGSVIRRIGDRIVSYTSEVQSNIRENRLTIKRAI
jgi:hypothetical protein